MCLMPDISQMFYYSIEFAVLIKFYNNLKQMANLFIFVCALSLIATSMSGLVTKFTLRSIAGQDYASCAGDYYLDFFRIINGMPTYINFAKGRLLARQASANITQSWFITSSNYAPSMEQQTKNANAFLGYFQISNPGNVPIEQTTWPQVVVTDIDRSLYKVQSVELTAITTGPYSGVYTLDTAETINTYFVYVNTVKNLFLAISGGSTWVIASTNILNQVRDDSFGLNNYAFAGLESNNNGAVPIQQSTWAYYTVMPTFTKN